MLIALTEIWGAEKWGDGGREHIEAIIIINIIHVVVIIDNKCPQKTTEFLDLATDASAGRGGMNLPSLPKWDKMEQNETK
jgi:hypothetical protein